MIYAWFFHLSVCSSQIWSLALAHQRHIGIRNTPLGTGSGLFLPFFSSFSGTMLSSSLPSASSSPSSVPLASGTNPASGSGTNDFLLAPGVTVDDPVSMFIGAWEDPAAENEALASSIIPDACDGPALTTIGAWLDPAAWTDDGALAYGRKPNVCDLAANKNLVPAAGVCWGNADLKGPALGSRADGVVPVSGVIANMLT